MGAWSDYVKSADGQAEYAAHDRVIREIEKRVAMRCAEIAEATDIVRVGGLHNREDDAAATRQNIVLAIRREFGIADASAVMETTAAKVSMWPEWKKGERSVR